MKKITQQVKLLFTSPKDAVSVDPPIWQSLTSGGIILVFSFLLLLTNSLSPSVFGVTLFPLKDMLPLHLLGYSILTQFVCIGLPMFIVYGKKGAEGYLRNFMLIQLCSFGLIIIGFLYHEVFWNLYKILPFSGLTANAIFEAALLLYPALILVLFRYILLWMIVLKNDSSNLKIIVTVILHLTLSYLMWFLGGLI